MRYEKYELGKLATIKKVKGLPLDKYETGEIPYVTGSQSNNGVVGYVTAPDDAISDGNCIVVDPIKGLCMYQPNNFVGRGFSGASINALYIEGLNELNAMYIIATIEKYSTKVANYGNLFNSNRLSGATIELPTLDELDENSPYSEEGFVPNFDYMQERIEELERERIEELERERIEELEHYLVAAGLNDYELTDEDIKTLSLSGFGDYEERDLEDAIKVCKAFKISDLFTKKTMKGYPKVDENLDENPNGYYVYGQNIQRQHPQKVLLDAKYLHIVSEDNPILAYTSSVGEIGMICEPFYRSGDNGAFQGLFSKHHQFNKYELQFILSILRKYFDNFGYTTGMAHIMDLTFPLPIQTDANNNPIIDTECKYHPDGYIPDFDFMEKYIKAIEKIVIADVVKYKDAVISKTKEVVA